MQVATETQTLDVPIPDALCQRLNRRAADNQRSLNDEILYRLEESVRRQESETQTGKTKRTTAELLDGALWAARNVSSSVGLLSDLFGEMGIARRDGDARQLSRALAVILHEAEKVEKMLDEAISEQDLAVPDVARSIQRAAHQPRTVSNPQ